jgi:hypothetical protein
MNFKNVIMNPPFGNKHLPILKKMVEEVVDKNDGQIVSIQPVRWLQDPLWQMKNKSDAEKMKPVLEKKIKNLVTVTAEEATKMFNAEITIDLAIFSIAKNGTFDYYSPSKSLNFIKDIVSTKYRHFTDVADSNKKDGIRVMLNQIGGSRKRGGYIPHHSFLYTKNGKTEDGKDWTEARMRNQYTKPLNSPIPFSIKFSSKNEADNFIDSLQTKFYRYLDLVLVRDVNISNKYFPWLEDYTRSWTDEQLYEHFNVSGDEQKIIEDTMKQYEI